MYYHIIIETKEKIGKNGRNRQYVELDNNDIEDIESRIINPFVKGENFQFNGYFLQADQIARLVVKETRYLSAELKTMENNRTQGVTTLFYSSDVVQNKRYSIDITQEILSKAKALINTPKDAPSKHLSTSSTQSFDSKKIFIVHGRDDLAKTEVARFVEKLGYSAIILHEQVNAGKTIIEKIDEHTNVGFGLVLYTPCDIGGLVGDENQKNRARQNVVFEHGYLMGKIGRDKVCALVKGDIETPNDISGVVYVSLDDPGAWKMKVAKEMRDLGYQIDMNKII